MKVRTDYVSNSSSSSFIIANSKMLEKFKIGKQDFIDAFKALLPEKEHKNFRVYDMHQKRDVKALENIKGCLQGWCCSESYVDKNTGQLTNGDFAFEKWSAFRDVFQDVFDIYCYGDYNNDDDYEHHIWKYDKKDGHCIESKTVPAPKWAIKLIRKIRKELGALDNWEAAHRPETRFVIHFDDNVLWELEGCQTRGKYEKLETPWGGNKGLTKYQREKNKEIKISTWNSEGWSLDRVCEILMRYWVKIGRIDPKDPIFTELLGEERMKEENPDLYPALYFDIISFNGHEG